MNFPNHGPRVGHDVYVNFLPSLAKMVPPISSTPATYELAHAVGAFLILSHCRCPTYTPFMRDNLKVTHSTPITTSTFNR